MKMARASEQDMEVANEVAQFIEDLLKGYMPECISKADDGYEYFMIEEPDDCQRALRKLLEIADRGSLFRVTFGMSVLLGADRLLDPNDDCLALHPQIASLLNNLAPTP